MLVRGVDDAGEVRSKVQDIFNAGHTVIDVQRNRRAGQNILFATMTTFQHGHDHAADILDLALLGTAESRILCHRFIGVHRLGKALLKLFECDFIRFPILLVTIFAYSDVQNEIIVGRQLHLDFRMRLPCGSRLLLHYRGVGRLDRDCGGLHAHHSILFLFTHIVSPPLLVQDLPLLRLHRSDLPAHFLQHRCTVIGLDVL